MSSVLTIESEISRFSSVHFFIFHFSFRYSNFQFLDISHNLATTVDRIASATCLEGKVVTYSRYLYPNSMLITIYTFKLPISYSNLFQDFSIISVLFEKIDFVARSRYRIVYDGEV
jgi:hypothetical protein